MSTQEWYQYLKEQGIVHLLFDSRQLVHPKETLFIAIKGERNDGHRYISELYKRGVRHFLVQDTPNKTAYPDAVFIPSMDTVKTLQDLAYLHRQSFTYPVIGITGSNGKTIVKEWLNTLLKPDYTIVRSPQSYNSQIGVPLSIWQMSTTHNLGIFEAGISRVGEMENIAPIIDCNWGVFTALGSAHDTGFSSRVEKAKEKCQLFQQAEKVFYHKEIETVDSCIQELARERITWSYRGNGDLNIKQITPLSNGRLSRIIGVFKGKTLELEIPFTDEASIENAILCGLVLLEMGMQQATIQERMKRLKPVSMRLEIKQGVHQCRIINDTYNLDITSLQSSLRFMKAQAGEKACTLIISDIQQHKEQALYQLLANEITQIGVSKIIGIGQHIPTLQSCLSEHIEQHYYTDTSSFLTQINLRSFRDEIILVKGARAFKFEQIVKRLEQKIHRTLLEVNLSAFGNNLAVYRRLLAKETKVMVMVKASAYGSGLVEVAQFMETQGVDYFAVAYMDEGVSLRNTGITTPILVLNVEPSSFDALLRYDLEPEIYNLSQLQQLQTVAQSEGITAPKIHIKLDTGMKRLGFETADIPDLVAYLEKHPFQVQSVFSHLAGSDVAEHDGFTTLQIQRFEQMYPQICAVLTNRPMRHILNSAGIARFTEQQWEMVRLGIGLYGLSPDKQIQHQLQTIGTLKATISQIKHLAIGESIGYNRGSVVQRPTRTATVSIGYADGLPRSAGYGNYKLSVRGHLVPTIGVICMDMCMIDITDFPDIQAGDEVIIFGEQPTIEDLATALDTIPYEVLTSISERVKRVYVLN